jgi:hypothetical protein
MPPLVDGDDGVPELTEPASDTVPEVGVRRQAMHEKHWNAGLPGRSVLGPPFETVEDDVIVDCDAPYQWAVHPARSGPAEVGVIAMMTRLSLIIAAR